MSSSSAPVGVLLLQLGTPDEPTAPAVKRYLREFLSDPRVIETPRNWRRRPRIWRAIWWCILRFAILRKRPPESAAKYRRIWHPETGSPLLHYTVLQANALQKALPGNTVVRFAMRYGNPAVATVVGEMIAAGVDRLIALPLYPQYSASTTASALDGLFAALMKERRVPALRIVPPYYAHPAYLEAVTAIIDDEHKRLTWTPDYRVLSFHGIPTRYVEDGDPYAEQVTQTSRLLAERLGWREGEWVQTYQSVFGKEPWLRPYTEETVQELARRGARKILIAMPGFTTDCLETIDEIGREVAEAFQHAGGLELHRCPCLNDHPLWITAMRTMVLEEGQGWLK